MSAKQDDGRAAEVLRLHYLEGASVRLIARKMKLARKTVRQMLGRKLPKPTAPPAPRERVRDRARVLAHAAPGVHAQPIAGVAPALHGAGMSLLWRDHPRRRV